MSKMDGLASRTPADLERKYNFGKSFAEVMGIANDAQTYAKEAKEIAKKVEADVMNIDVVKELNVSSGTITLKSKGLTIESDGFSLSADDGIKAIKGNIGLWDITESSISKNTDSTWININASETADDDFITVSTLENGLVKDVPLCVKANGNIFTRGLIESSNESRTRYTIIDSGTIDISGEWDAHHDIYMKFLLMSFIGASGEKCGVYAYGQFTGTDVPVFSYDGITIEPM